MAHPHPVREGGAEWTREDVTRPEGANGVEVNKPVAQSRDEEQSGEQEPGTEVAQTQRRRGHVTDGRAQGEGRGDRRPVEQLASGRGDAVNRERPFDPVPREKDHGEHSGEPGGGNDVGNAEPYVDDVGAHGAKDTHHHYGEPVPKSAESGETQLPDEHYHEDDPSAQHRCGGGEVVNEVIRRRLTHRRGQYLDEPEDTIYLRDLARLELSSQVDHHRTGS